MCAICEFLKCCQCCLMMYSINNTGIDKRVGSFSKKAKILLILNDLQCSFEKHLMIVFIKVISSSMLFQSNKTMQIPMFKLLADICNLKM